MSIPLSFQCNTCKDHFEWTEMFRRPNNGRTICSACLYEWFLRTKYKYKSKQERSQEMRERAQVRWAREREKSRERAEEEMRKKKDAKNKA